jgi:hypothetical protein
MYHMDQDCAHLAQHFTCDFDLGTSEDGSVLDDVAAKDDDSFVYEDNDDVEDSTCSDDI